MPFVARAWRGRGDRRRLSPSWWPSRCCPRCCRLRRARASTAARAVPARDRRRRRQTQHLVPIQPARSSGTRWPYFAWRGRAAARPRDPAALDAARLHRRRQRPDDRRTRGARTTCSPKGFGPGFNGPLAVVGRSQQRRDGRVDRPSTALAADARRRPGHRRRSANAGRRRRADHRHSRRPRRRTRRRRELVKRPARRRPPGCRSQGSRARLRRPGTTAATIDIGDRIAERLPMLLRRASSASASCC